jgi:hypothetical protein
MEARRRQRLQQVAGGGDVMEATGEVQMGMEMQTNGDGV